MIDMRSPGDDIRVSTASRETNDSDGPQSSMLPQPRGDESSTTTNTNDGTGASRRSNQKRERVAFSEQESEDRRGERARSSRVNREFLVHRGRRRSYNHLVRPTETAEAMSFQQRLWNDMKALFCCPSKMRRKSNQYRIPPQDEFKFVPFQWLSKLTEGTAVDWCLWHYRTGFMWSILAFLLFYFVLIFLYTFIIFGLNEEIQSRTTERCLLGWDFTTQDLFLDNFNIAFELSWTTLSTVGFGSVNIPADASCRAMRYVLATEAFIGVLYIGFCGAIFYAKISRGLATAPVTFSSVICLRYGKALRDARHEVSLSGSSNASEVISDKVEGVKDGMEEVLEELSTFPFLEFRVINDQANKKGAEISDASVSCMAVSFRLIDRYSQHKTRSEPLGMEYSEDEKVQHDKQVRMTASVRAAPNVKRTYRTVKLKHPKHPHFGLGAWYLQHSLDQTSPFLRGSVKRRISELGGWPTSWNNHEKIRTCLNPNIYEIGMIFTGLSNLNLVDVFKIQAWKPEDIYIGWQFVSTSYLDKSGRKTGGKKPQWKVDRSLIHDIIPQTHGGNESLTKRCPEVNIPQFLGRRHQLSEED